MCLILSLTSSTNTMLTALCHPKGMKGRDDNSHYCRVLDTYYIYQTFFECLAFV